MTGDEFRHVESPRALQGATSIGTDGTYAGVWPRLTALVADIVLMSCVFFPVTRMVKGTWVMSTSNHDWVRGWFVSDPLCLSFLVVMFLYFVLLEGLGGATVGKRLMRLRVVDVNGGRAGLIRSLIRNVLRVVDGLPTMGLVGAILIVMTQDRMRVGDLVAGTRVVRNRRRVP
ncbi:RDD family protein [bacterium]|nr:RDD family protein [bacterium]